MMTQQTHVCSFDPRFDTPTSENPSKVQMETEPDDFHLFPGDFSTYTLRSIICGQRVTLAGSIGET